ncbi:MAG: GNAT family N-acetyltransferase [Marmoricola sp.]
MTSLELPAADHYESWAACVEEFGGVLDERHGDGHWYLPEGLRTRTDRETYDVFLGLLRRMGRDPVEPQIPSDHWWIVEEGVVVGFLAIRHRLNAELLDHSGHIGYSIRPSRRGEGHASRALGLALHRCRALGIDRVLVACDDDNEPSARTIERNGGVMEDIRDGVRRYWIDVAG